MHKRAPQQTPKWSTPPRVRYEPATIEEAVSAAQDLASDREQQVEIAAGFMGLEQDQVREHVLRQPAKPLLPRNMASSPAGVVVVERRSLRSRIATGRPLSS